MMLEGIGIKCLMEAPSNEVTFEMAIVARILRDIVQELIACIKECSVRNHPTLYRTRPPDGTI